MIDDSGEDMDNGDDDDHYDDSGEDMDNGDDDDYDDDSGADMDGGGDDDHYDELMTVVKTGTMTNNMMIVVKI